MSDKKTNILVIEDDLAFLEALKLFLTHSGYRVLTATDGSEALKVVQQHEIKCIVCDIMLPKLSGFEFRRLIMNNPDYQLIPFVYITAVNKQEIKHHVYELHADDILIKPFEFEELLLRIVSHVKKFELLESRIRYDTLTGVLNRKFWERHLNLSLHKATSDGSKVSVVLLDVDNFKSLNDTLGHFTGDKTLKSIARFLSLRTRRNDVVGRLGGDEFAIIMPETGKQECFNLISRLHRNAARFQLELGSMPFSFSSGVATFPDDGCDSSELLTKADQAQYFSKRHGKAKVTMV